MQTTIDAAGRIVVPKALRDAMGLTPGQVVDVVFSDGRLEIEVAPIDAHVQERKGLPVIVPDSAPPPLDPELVRQTLEATRR